MREYKLDDSKEQKIPTISNSKIREGAESKGDKNSIKIFIRSKDRFRVIWLGVRCDPK